MTSGFTKVCSGVQPFEISMRNLIFALSLILSSAALVRAGELAVSTTVPVVVVAPDGWQSAKDQSPLSAAAPFETFKVFPPAGRNAVCLVSILDRDKPAYAAPAMLKKILRGDCRPYVGTAAELPNVELKELKIGGGLGFYANFIDPDLLGKPATSGAYKTATPIILSIGAKVLIKATILCDDLNGADYRQAFQMVESLKMK